jgi:hypothetical protein
VDPNHMTAKMPGILPLFVPWIKEFISVQKYLGCGVVGQTVSSRHSLGLSDYHVQYVPLVNRIGSFAGTLL